MASGPRHPTSPALQHFRATEDLRDQGRPRCADRSGQYELVPQVDEQHTVDVSQDIRVAALTQHQLVHPSPIAPIRRLKNPPGRVPWADRRAQPGPALESSGKSWIPRKSPGDPVLKSMEGCTARLMAALPGRTPLFVGVGSDVVDSAEGGQFELDGHLALLGLCGGDGCRGQARSKALCHQWVPMVDRPPVPTAVSLAR
jgi:hypothetical protein